MTFTTIRARLALALAPAAFATLAPAAAHAEQRQFSHDGVAYTYKVSTEASGARTISGNADGKTFRLRVAKGWVKGFYNGQPISFRTSEVVALPALAMK